MIQNINILKGVHPGLLIKRELTSRNISQRSLAKNTQIPYQTINAIICGRRNLTTQQSIAIEKFFSLDDGFLAIIQTLYDREQYIIHQQSRKHQTPPNVRKILFWDTEWDKINWSKHKDAVIYRVLNRGNNDEITEIKRYYNITDSELKKFI